MALSLYEKEKRGRESIIAEFDNSLQDFKENLGSSSKIEAHFSRLLVGSAIASSRKLDFEMALALTELAIKKNPEDYNAIAEKGFIHLIRHEFTKANEALQQCSTQSPHIYDLIRVARNYYILKPNDEQRLTNEQFLGFLEELPSNRAWLKSYMLIYDRKVNPSMTAHSDLVKGYIISLNPNLTKENFNYKFTERPEGNHLDISNNRELKTLKNMGGKEFPYLSILRTLDLKTLNVSDSGLLNLSNLVRLDLEEINIANTPVRNFQILDEFTTTPTLYVSRSQDLSKCPKDVKIIYVD
jgi:tetratricopeptide (TPR) repeat protein